MSIEIKRSDKYVDYNISATNNRGYITIDTSDWINKPWMFYELPALKFEIYTETDGELVKYQNFSREIRTYNPVYSPLGVLNVTIDIRNVPEEFILRITPIFDNDAVVARNMLIENGIENGDIWGSDQDVPTQSFDLDIEFIECEGEYIPPVQPTHEETITGVPPITFNGSTGEPLVSWTILGNSSQSGTPTPDNPVMPTFCGVRTGNLAKYWQNAYVRATDGAVVSQQRNGMSYPLSVSAGQTITFSANTDNFSIGIAVFRDFDGTTPSDMIFRELTAYTYTATENCYVVVWCNYDNTTIMSESNFDLCKVMLNLGSTALPYEPFGWAEKITCAGQTVPVYLGQRQTVRRIKKLVLTGQEGWIISTGWKKTSTSVFYTALSDIIHVSADNAVFIYSNAFAAATRNGLYNGDSDMIARTGTEALTIRVSDEIATTVADFKAYLAEQYAAGTPVTLWYVLAEPETGIVNEPLCKIGTYADELHSTDAGVMIPTAKGQNTLTVETDLQPGEMTITYIKEGQ